MKLRELGEAVGGIDYRTVGTAIRKFERRLSHDKHLRQAPAQIEHQYQKEEM